MSESRPSELARSALSWLSGVRGPNEPLALTALRAEAARYFREQGLPHPKLEGWRFTSLRALLSQPFSLPVARELDFEFGAFVDQALGQDDAFRVIVLDGRPILPDASAPAGIELRGVAELLRSAPDRVSALIGRAAPLLHGFTALNTALFEDGLCVFVRAGKHVERALHVVFVSSSAERATLSLPRLLVVAETGSALELLETHLQRGAEPHLRAGVSELFLRAGARVDHTRFAQGTDAAHGISVLGVLQERDSRYESRVATLGAALERLDLAVSLTGEGAECSLDGLYMVDRSEHVDHQTLVEHVAPHTTSLQKYKGMLAGKGHAVFDGTVVVRPSAQRTNAHQENRNLLFSDDAIVNTKPHLEIDADDVRCSHGATIGQLDAAQLYYLCTRGIRLDEAKAMLGYAFAREMVDRIVHADTRRRVGEAVLGRLPAGMQDPGP